MGTTERRAREKANLRRAILDAARELFVTDGYDAVSMRKIADRIEYSPTTIYLHFKDKDEILVALSEEGFLLLCEHVEKIQTADPVERLRQGGHAYLQFARTHTNYYKIMFQIEANALLKGHKPEETAPHRAFAFIRKCVLDAQASGQFDAALPEPIVSHVVWASMHGAASLAISGRLGMLPDEAHPAVFDGVIENTLRGLRA